MITSYSYTFTFHLIRSAEAITIFGVVCLLNFLYILYHKSQKYKFFGLKTTNGS